jgi:hypothetical protein
MGAVTVLWLSALNVGFVRYLMVNTTLLGNFPIIQGND